MTIEEIKAQWDERARRLLADFATNAQTLADAAKRASEGNGTEDDRALLATAWEESARYSRQYSGLLVQQNTGETHVWEHMKHYLYPDPEELGVGS